MKADITLVVPAETAHVHLLRSVMAGVAARADRSVDEISDLKLAVDEAAGLVLAAGPASTLTFRVAREGGDLRLELASDARVEVWPSEAMRTGFAWGILSALVDVAEPEGGPQGPALLLVKRRPSVTTGTGA